MRQLSRTERYILDSLNKGEGVKAEGFGTQRIARAFKSLIRSHFVSRINGYRITKTGARKLESDEDQLELF